MNKAILWHKILSIFSVGSISLWSYLWITTKPAMPHFALTWDAVWTWRPYLALMYVIACAIRSFWPRHDGDRVCMYNNFLSTPLVGRFLAMLAEISFALLIAVYIARFGKQPAVAIFIVGCIVIAQMFCNYAVLTRNQLGHVFEESLWTLCAFLVLVVSASRFHQPLFRWMFIISLVYIIFMITVDVPMYWKRFLKQKSTDVMNWYEGLYDISICKKLDKTEAFWIPEMPWMSGYFTIAVWLTIYMAYRTC